MTDTIGTTTGANRPGDVKTFAKSISVRPVACHEARAAWAQYVADTPGATFFHNLAWCDAVASAFGHLPLHRIALRGDRVVGVLPLMEVHSLLAGRLLISVPYGTYGGVVADDQEARDALAGVALRLVYERGARQLELRSESAVIPGLPVDDRYSGFVRNLPVDLKGLETYLPRKARAAARQAVQRENLTVTHEPNELRTVYDLYVRSMRRLASVNYPYRLFEELQQHLGNRFWVTVVRKEGQPVAGLISFVHRDTVLPYFLGVDERIRCTGATNLVYFATMERAVKCQLAKYDFGRTRTGNEGPFAFKVNQGFEPRTLGYQRYTPPGQSDPNLSPSNPRYDLARRVWRRLPLSLTRPLGSWLSRSIPG